VLCGLSVATVNVAPTVAQTRTSEFVPSFATNTRVKQQVERLSRLAEQKLWDEWVKAYQQLVDADKDTVLARDNEFLVGVRYHCHQLLAAQPAAVRQRYRALFDEEARKLYAKSLAAGDAAGMLEVYSRFRFSSSAGPALKWSADRALEAGRPEWARVAYGRLAKEPGVSVTTLLRYAIAADAAGKPAEAASALDRVRKELGAQPVKLAGEDSTGAAAADQVARGFRSQRETGSGASWPSFGGLAGDRNMGKSVSGELKKLWEFAPPAGAEAAVRPTQQLVLMSSTSGSTRARFPFLTFPAVSGERVWFQGPRNLTSLKLTTGETLWDQQDYTLSRDQLPTQNADPRAGGISYRANRPVQAAPSVDGRLLVTRMPLAEAERTGRWPVDFALLAVDSRTGSELWRRMAGGEPRGIYYNIPALQANTVVTGVATYKGGITEYNAVALDAGTGEPLWNTYLGGGSDPLASVDGSPAAIKDGIVWIESSLYTLNALDLLTGEVRMIYRYDPGRRLRTSGVDTSPTLSNEPISLIATAAGPVVFAPRWGIDAVALDPVAGKLLWSSPKGPNQTTMGSLFAVDGKRAYVGGDHLQAISLADGARDWTWEPMAIGGLMGFPVLCGDRIYVTIEGKIHVHAADDGREIEVLDTAEIIGEASGIVTLVAVDGALLVSSRDRIVALGRK
jgi:outer membrane protein assembly factor BamB